MISIMRIAKFFECSFFQRPFGLTRTLIVAMLLTVGTVPASAQTFTANNGLIHEIGGLRIAVDALFRDAFDEYPPLDGVDVILATHRHLDHMVPEAMASYLCHSSGTLAFIPSDARDNVLEAATCTGVAERIRSGFEPFKIDSLTITPVAVPHARVDNRAYVFEYGGRRAVHLGDSSLSENLGNSDFLDLCRRAGSPFLILIHAPPADRARVQSRLDALGFEGWVPRTPLETRP